MVENHPGYVSPKVIVSTENVEPSDRMKAIVSDATTDAPQQSITSRLMVSYVDLYVDEQKRRWKHGEKFPNAPQQSRISAARYVAYRNCGDKLKAVWSKESLPTDEKESHRLVKMFREKTQDLLLNDKISPATFNERVKTLRHFFGWLYDNYHIQNMPRKMDELCSRYKVEVSARALSPELIRSIFNASKDRTRLYVALALNCGLYAVDLSCLKHSDFRDGYLYYIRNKTGVPARYKLWKITRRLLTDVLKDGENGLLFHRDGKPIVMITPDDDGVMHRTSHPESSLMMVKKRLKLKAVSFSNFRDTSSTKIESIDRSLTDLFNAHADQRMAKWYVDADHIDYDRVFAKLDAATDELEKWYALK